MEIKIVNATTGEEIVRPMNEQELADFQALQKESAKLAKEQAAKEAARQSAIEKLAALGLTEAEIKALTA